VNRLAEDIKHLHALGFSDVVATFAHGVSWDDPSLEEDLTGALEELCEFYLANPDMKECSLFGMHLPNILREKKGVKKWCGTGTHMVAYDVNGKSYPCHTFQRIALGDEASDWENMEGPVDFARIADFRDEDCSACVIEGVCPNCYGMNYVTRRDILKRDKQMCALIKAQTMANSYLWGERLRRGLSKLDPPDTYQMIKAVQLVQNTLLQQAK
jgi:radical SAM protein with 4Fe4S-binding SPASM domain